MANVIPLHRRATTHARWVLGAGFLAFVVAGFVSAALGPSLPFLAAALGFSLADAGVLRAVRQGGALVAQLPAGWLLDRWGPRAMLMAGACLVGLGLLGTVTGPTLGATLVSSLVLGVGTGCLEVAPNVAVGLLYTGSTASAMLAGLHAFYGAGATLGPVVVGVVGWQATYLVGGLLCVGVMGLAFSAGAPRAARDGQGGAALRWPSFAPLAVFVLIYNGLEFGVGDWLYVQLRLGLHAGESLALQTSALFWLALTVGRVAAVPLLRRFGREAALAGALGLALVGLVGVTLLGMPLAVAVAGAGLAALGFAPIHPICVSMASDSQPGAEGKAIGILGAVAALGSMALPVAQGWVGAGHDGGMALPLVGVVALILIGMFWIRLWR